MSIIYIDTLCFYFIIPTDIPRNNIQEYSGKANRINRIHEFKNNLFYMCLSAPKKIKNLYSHMKFEKTHTKTHLKIKHTTK